MNNNEIRLDKVMDIEVIPLDEDITLLLSCCGCADEDNEYNAVAN